MQEADIPHGEVLSLDDLFDNEHLKAVGFFSDHTHPSEGDVTVVDIPVTFSRTPGTVRRLAPNLGEDSPHTIIDEWSSIEIGNQYAD